MKYAVCFLSTQTLEMFISRIELRIRNTNCLIGLGVSKTDVKRIMRFVVTTLGWLEDLIDLKSAYELNF